MIRSAVGVVFVAAAATLSADITPRGPRIVGPKAVVGAIYTVEFLRVSRLEKGRPPRVFLRIKTPDRIHGELTLEQELKIGEPLGIVPGGDIKYGKLLGSKLLIVLQKDPEVVFFPEAKVHSVNQLEEWETRACQVARMPDGTTGCVDMVKRRIAAFVNEVVLEEKGGRKVTLRNVDHEFGAPLDALCTVHGGRIGARLLTPAEKEEARAALFWESAEEEWKSKNPALKRRAQQGYARLLKDYPEARIVVANKDRIKARAEEPLEE